MHGPPSARSRICTLSASVARQSAENFSMTVARSKASSGKGTTPARTIPGSKPSAPPTAKTLYVKETTSPKLPPPPRSAQKSSGSLSALAVTSVPSASTTSADTRLSMASPTRGVSQPMPPPRVSPPIPVSGCVPSGAAKLWGLSALSTSAIFAPPSAVTTMRSGSTMTPFILRRLMRKAPFGMHIGEWPPESTATFFPAASLTTATTSCAVVGIAITAGQSLTLLFQQSSRALR
jgi:hypothetical protein